MVPGRVAELDKQAEQFKHPPAENKVTQGASKPNHRSMRRENLVKQCQSGLTDWHYVVSQPVVDPRSRRDRGTAGPGVGILAHPLQLLERRRVKARRLGRPVEGVVSRPVFQLALQRPELGDVAAEDGPRPVAGSGSW